MKLQDRFFPRVWDGKKYWYPVFSELRITYECPDLPFAEENLRNLTWALDWHFPIKAEGGKLEVLNEELLWKGSGELTLYNFTIDQVKTLTLHMTRHINKNIEKFNTLRKKALECKTDEEIYNIIW